MKIEHIRTFIEVAMTGSCNAAAKNLNVTQATVSARLRVLEDQLNNTLFIRARQNLSLSAAGRRFLKYARATVENWERARIEIDCPDNNRESYRLGLSIFLHDRLMLQIIAAVANRFEQVGISTIWGHSNHLNDYLLRNLLDLAILSEPARIPGYVVDCMFEEELILVSSDVSQFKDVSSANYILVDWGSEFLKKHSELYGTSTLAKLTTPSETLALRLLCKNGGLAYLSTHTCMPHLTNRTLARVPDTDAIRRPVYAAYDHSLSDNAVITMITSGLKTKKVD